MRVINFMVWEQFGGESATKVWSYNEFFDELVANIPFDTDFTSESEAIVNIYKNRYQEGLDRDDGLVAIGNLTLRGVTREIELPFELNGPVMGMQGGKHYGVDATMKLNRQDFGVSWNRALDMGGVVVGDMVTIEIHVELVQNLND